MAAEEVSRDVVLLQQHALDTEFFVRRGVRKGFQAMSLAALPLYAAFSFSRYGRSHFTTSRLLRAGYIGGGVGAVGGGAFEYARSAYSKPDAVRTRRMQVAYDAADIRADDYSTIGAVLFAVLTPAIFWKRAGAIDLVLGGGAIGSAMGVLTHHFKYITGDRPPTVFTPPSQKTVE